MALAPLLTVNSQGSADGHPISLGLDASARAGLATTVAAALSVDAVEPKLAAPLPIVLLKTQGSVTWRPRSVATRLEARGRPGQRVTPDAVLRGPSSALCPLRTAAGQRLIAPAAAAFDAMSVAFTSAMNAPLCVADSHRDYASQVQVFATKPNLAATPGRSKHGLGRAVDLCGGVQNFGTAPYTWLKQNAPAFGFAHPDWAEPDGSRPEPWHWEFQG